MKKDVRKVMRQNGIVNFTVVTSLAVVFIFLIYSYNVGSFASEQNFAAYINSFGILSIIVFILIQISSVIFAILPTSLGCVVGVILFGPVYSFLYNYISICVGSIINFLLARHYGSGFVQSVIPRSMYNRYIDSIDNTKAFERGFALAIFFPLAPDDILCYLAGLSKIKTARYIAIIILGKPVSLLLYSIGISGIINYFT